MSQYNFTKTPVNIEQLTVEIDDNVTITKDVDYIRMKASGSDNLKIFFEEDLTAGEQTELGTVVTAHTASSVGDKNYLVKTYNNDILEKETWYHTDDGDGTYSDIVEETTYTYNESDDITSHTIKYYFKDDTEYSFETFDYYTNSEGNTLIIKKQ